ncbi:hypothetical protein GTP38_04705 [Duganella sp. FT94W]|uniref:DUF4397 domain-containing protein n=1 Tax=Duganella lactea TaxID=2692173 RepID=A0ABW9V4F5_9BURK|nr:hypothetical protein [Duganella lactea]MYM33637.1 hypothetical protein [Duganella lactea]
MRWCLMVLLLALVCRWGVAQVGPRYVIELPGTAAPAASQGRVQLAGKGLVLIRFQGLSVLVVAADAESYCQEAVPDWPAADLLVILPASAGRYEGLAPLRVLRDGVPVIVAEGAVDGGGGAPGPRLYPMQPWNTLDLRKHGTRLRVTALPGRPGTAALAGYLLDLGNRRASYRVYAGGAEDELAQRLPGADLALLPAQGGTRVLALNRGTPDPGEPATLTAAGYAFNALKR